MGRLYREDAVLIAFGNQPGAVGTRDRGQRHCRLVRQAPGQVTCSRPVHAFLQLAAHLAQLHAAVGRPPAERQELEAAASLRKRSLMVRELAGLRDDDYAACTSGQGEVCDTAIACCSAPGLQPYDACGAVAASKPVGSGDAHSTYAHMLNAAFDLSIGV